MAIGDLFKRKKKPDYLDMGDTGLGPGSMGPAGYGDPSQMGGMPGMQGMPDMSQGSMPQDLPGIPPMDFQSPMTPQQMPQRQQAGADHLENIRSQMEAINYKLDTLKAVLDSLNTRLANIENALKATPGGREGGWNY